MSSYFYYNNVFELYDPTIDYDLNTVAEFKTIQPERQLLYTVNERAKYDAFTLQSSDEPFIDVQVAAQVHGVSIHCQSGTTDYGGTSGPLHLRAEAARRLCQAAQSLQVLTKNQYQLLLTDAYRPLNFQRQHYEKIKTILEQQGYRGVDLYKHTTQRIADPDLLPPHTTGGTVDITLWNVQHQQPAWLGTAVDAIDSKHIHTWHRDVLAPERSLRVVLYQVMTEAGFINYPLEWWHYSYGDTEWALHANQTHTLYNSVEQLPSL